jgi:murein DD-endopeptidase MepM/ murein hydrolase activator NlpD
MAQVGRISSVKGKICMNKFNLENSRLGRRLGTKGLYIAIAACVIAAGGAGAAAYSKASEEIGDSINVSQADNKQSGVEKTDDSDVDSSEADLTDSLAEKDDSSESSDDTLNLDIKTQPDVMPVSGEVINPFSDGELVKSETLGVWKTHDGVDIKAEIGTKVKAMNKGKVLEVTDDPLWGGSIVIDHGNGVVGYYYNLSKTMYVSAGDTVNAGEVIGSVGDTAECEAAEPSHLHFGLKENGEWIDPIAFIQGK